MATLYRSRQAFSHIVFFWLHFVGDEDVDHHFSAASAGIIIQQVMECSSEMDNMRQRLHLMEQNVKSYFLECCTELETMRQQMSAIELKYKNIIDMMGRVKD